MNPVELPTSEQTEINKVLITGHPLSGFETVHSLLENAGMHTAHPSRREKMQPREITATLLKANRKRTSSNAIEQVAVSPVWNGLAMDLMMGNLDHEMWCWADPDALPLLEYWNGLDSRLAFVLVYDAPDHFIARSFAEDEEITPHALKTRLQEWDAYNRALMKFYLRHTERSFLVQVSQIHSNSAEYLEDVRKQLGLPLLSDPDSFSSVENIQDSTEPAQTLYGYLAREFLQHYPDSLSLYDELQSIANIPREESQTTSLTLSNAWTAAIRINKNAERKLQSAENELDRLRSENNTMSMELEGFAYHENELYTELHQIKKALQQQTLQSQKDQKAYENEMEQMALSADANVLLLNEKNTKLDLLTRERAELSDEISSLQVQVNQLLQEKQQQQQEAHKQTTIAVEAIGSLDALEKEKEVLFQENELLLTQLHRVQEALEEQYIQAQSEKQNLSTINAEKTLILDEAKEEVAQLKDDLGILVNKEAELLNRVRRYENDLNVSRKMNIDLTKENERLQQRLQQLSKTAFENDERIKESNHTTNSLLQERDRLSEVNIQLHHTENELLSKLASLEQQKNHLDSKVSELTSLLAETENKIKSLTSELEENKQNVQTQTEDNRLLLDQLHSVLEELERYYLKNRNLQKRIAAPEAKPSGAADRIKQQLSYRLGATLIDKSRSLSGWVTIPTALIRETKHYRREFTERSKQKLPPIHTYIDAHEAERMKKHLSYRLGKVIVESKRNPLKWGKLPWTISKTVRDYRKEQRYVRK